MNFGFLLGGQEEKLAPCDFDSDIRSMAEDSRIHCETKGSQCRE